MLRISDLSVSYAGIQALKGVSISVSQGEIVSLIGANGAGKSSLLRCISGLVRPSHGTVHFRDREITGAASHVIARTGLLHVPEGRQILSELTVEENLLLGALALNGRPAPFDLRDVFRLFPVIEERRNQLGGTLSGGQQQMLAIGRALMGGPQLLLLDEPSLGLAPIVSDQLFGALTALSAAGITLLIVEQNVFRALSVSARSYVLEQGRIVCGGPSTELRNDNHIVSHYLGDLPAG